MNFLTRLLNPDPNERITAAEALEDPWLLETQETMGHKYFNVFTKNHSDGDYSPRENRVE